MRIPEVIMSVVVFICFSFHAYLAGLWFLENEQQLLFVRLFLRKHQWICVPKLSYPDIAADLSPLLRNLVQERLLYHGWKRSRHSERERRRAGKERKKERT